MLNTYIVCFDFHKTRSKFGKDINFYYEDEFLGGCEGAKSHMITLFPNKVIELTTGAFLIRTQLGCEELLSYLIEKTATGYNRPVDISEQQIYVCAMNDIKFYTFRQKMMELEFVLST